MWEWYLKDMRLGVGFSLSLFFLPSFIFHLTQRKGWFSREKFHPWHELEKMWVSYNGRDSMERVWVIRSLRIRPTLPIWCINLGKTVTFLCFWFCKAGLGWGNGGLDYILKNTLLFDGLGLLATSDGKRPGICSVFPPTFLVRQNGAQTEATRSLFVPRKKQSKY